VTNEIGIDIPMETADRPRVVREEMVKKLTMTKFHADRFALWFSTRGMGTGHPGALIDGKQRIITNNAQTFKVLTDFLAPPDKFKGEFSDSFNKVKRYEFMIPWTGEIVRVIWSENPNVVWEEDLPPGSLVYDVLGQFIDTSGDKILLGPWTPYYAVR
jgi:hypothetical protein